MPRLLLFLALAFLVGLVFRALTGARAKNARREAPAAPASPPAAAPRADAEVLQQCAWCGLHMSASAALALPDGRAYCSAGHRDAAAAAARERR